MRTFVCLAVLLCLSGCSRQKEKELVAEQAAISNTVAKRKADLTPAQKDQFIEATAQSWYNFYLLQGGKPRVPKKVETVLGGPAEAPKAVPAKAKAETERKYNGD